MSPLQMLHEAVRLALTEPAEDIGINAGEHYVTLASERGLDLTDSVNTYRCAINHAAIADIVVSAIHPDRTWDVPQALPSWNSSCLIAGGFLRRFVAVSHWNDDRLLYESRSWYCLGELAHYRLPMQLIVANVGHMSGGRRTGYWSKALLHPQRSSLRFRRRARSSIEGFKESWSPVYREEHDEIDREKWLQAMLDDGVLQESLFVVNIPVPPETECRKIQELATRQLQRLHSLKDLPDQQLSTCFDPLSPCPFRSCCHGEQEQGPEMGGFDRMDAGALQ